ncbi:MAG TPA: HesA/MoeB/ThiF family protein [Flavobacterium sp.]|nr:HesA/MoeB/ThiF family protein [Flavobacterium sp.]
MKEKSNRYIRQIALPEIGLRGQQLLHDAKVLVIGAGGLGCPVMQQLAAVGVGTVGIVDGDCIEESNLHRQILFTTEDCGKNKAVTASEKLAQINPDVITKVYAEFFTVTNANLISNDYDIIVDCTDTITSRYLINDISLVKNIPMVYASIHKFEGQVSVFNYKNGPSYRCLFPENETKKDVPNCVTSGVLGVLPNTLGMIQTTEVLKIILGIGEVLSGKLLLYNALNCQTQLIEYAKNQVEIKRGNERGKRIAIEINSRILELERNQFFEKANTPNCLLIDVRESHEQPRLTFENVLEIPLKNLEVQIENIDKNHEIILFCQSGKRSQFALEIFKGKGFSKLSHLKNGIQSLELKLSD